MTAGAGDGGRDKVSGPACLPALAKNPLGSFELGTAAVGTLSVAGCRNGFEPGAAKLATGTGAGDSARD